MNIRTDRSRLSNGIDVVLIHRKYSRVAAVKVYFRAGSRYDPVEKGLSGVAHLTEHLVSKTNKQIFSEIESRGGRLDAGTSREYVFLSAVTLSQGLFNAIDILSETILNPDFGSLDVESEKLIIAEEINRRQDKEEILFDLFLATLFENHSLGNPVFGSLQDIENIGAQDVNDFYARYFTGKNTVISVCGDFSETKVLEYLERKFSGLSPGEKISRKEKYSSPGIKHIHKEMELNQVHILMGVPAPDMRSKDKYCFKLIDIILGTGANSFLYKQLREKDKLVYSIYSVYSNYEDAGYFVIKTSCAPYNVKKVEETVHNQIRRLTDEHISPGVISSAKKQYEGRLYRSFETNNSIASIFGIETLLSKIEPFEESIKMVGAVSEKDLSVAARKWLNKESCIVVTAGKM